MAIDSGDNFIEVDLGFGKLSISIEENLIKYRFNPSKKLEDSIINVVVNGDNEFTFVLEKNLVQKITNIYKDMF